MTALGSTCVDGRWLAAPRMRIRRARGPAAASAGRADPAALDVLGLCRRGAGVAEVAEMIRDHESCRGPGGRAAWIRRLRQLGREAPERTTDLERIAVRLMACAP
ncbi:hypothetical protein J2S43_004641 [Catenuloplanes nepalensis]|uniref:Uncharacterized protein n=1 Tax=Catenuloplanes nepalensis TaxID=587533 RepID=A0ABT9MXL7_9ACTN|nr:hypothetical protein [Catenuloplanes nepalensis]MDP9796129.1 hypothetical protein [Catenuloplanes nepalensis]